MKKTNITPNQETIEIMEKNHASLIPELPILIMYWSLAGGKYRTWRNDTGELKDFKEFDEIVRYEAEIGNNTMLLHKGRSVTTRIAKYNKELDILTFGYYTLWNIRTGNGKNPHPEIWYNLQNYTTPSVYAIRRGDPMIYRISMRPSNSVVEAHDAHRVNSNRHLGAQTVMAPGYNDYVNNMTAIQAIKNFIAKDTPDADPYSYASLLNWYNNNYKQNKSASKSKEIEKYLDEYDYGYVPTEEDFSKYGLVPGDYGRMYGSSLCKYTLVNKDWEVLSIYDYDYDYNPSKEHYRIYISKNGIKLKHHTSYGWQNTTSIYEYWRKINYVLINKEDIDEQSIKFRYFVNAFERLNENPDVKHVINTIITAMRHPLVEKLIKANYINLGNYLARSNTINKDMGALGVSDKSSLNDFGPKSWLNFLNEQPGAGFSRSKKLIQSRLGDNFLTELGSKDLEALLDVWNQIGTYRYDSDIAIIAAGIDGSTWRYGNIGRDPNNGFMKVIRKAHNNSVKSNGQPISVENYISIVSDSISNLNRCISLTPEEKDASWTRITENKNYDYIVQEHDRLLGILGEEQTHRRELEAKAQAEKDKRLEKDFTKRLPDLKDKYFSEDNDYIIVFPQNPQDMRIEGNILNHCIGGYVDRHASASTDIMFLRKKSAPEARFFSMEVNNGRVIQIHGKGNRWLGTEPNAIPFMINWCKEHKIKCDKTILLDRSSSYCGRREYVAPENYGWKDERGDVPIED